MQGQNSKDYMTKEDTLQLYEYLRFLARTPKIGPLAPLLDPRDEPLWYPSESELEADPFTH